MEDDLSRGLVDEEMKELLRLLNLNGNLATTSSCSGRIVVACSDKGYDDKRSTRFTLKSHSPVSVEQVKRALEEADCKYVWIKSSHPLIDVATEDLETALRLVNLAQRSGFKYSGVQQGRSFYRVLIRSNDNIHIPIFKDEDLKRLARITSVVNKFLLEGKVKLARLVSMLVDEGFIEAERMIDDLFGDLLL